MTPKERINGIFSSAESQIKFLQWILVFGVALSSTFSGLSYSRIDSINQKYIEIKVEENRLNGRVDKIDEKVNEHSVQLDSLSKRLSIIELSNEQIEKIKLLKKLNNGN